MALSNAGKDALLEGLASVAGYASLHTGDPSTTGANEVSGGSYAREIVPSFSATAYFGFAIRAARWLSTGLFRVRVEASKKIM